MIRRGDVYWAELGLPRGAAPGHRRPVVVIQSDIFNQTRIATVAAVILTSNLDLARAPGNVLLPRSITKLEKDSVANVSQLVTVDIADLDDKPVVHLSSGTMEEIDDGLRLVLALEDR